MGNFNNDRKFGGSRGGRKFGGGDFNPRRSFSRGSDRNQMHDAVCAECGNGCKVPFAPSNGKPVYCSDCFEKRGNSNDSFRKPRTFSDRPSFSERRPFSAPEQQAPRTPSFDYKKIDMMNAKLDKILKVLTPFLNEEAKAEVVVEPTVVVKDVAVIEKTDTEEAPVKVKKPRAKKVKEVTEVTE
jgi:CxxC-x17-CxxC domain-containing protein